MAATQERAIRAGGFFWGMQQLVRRLLDVVSTRVGDLGGYVKKATYRNTGTLAEATEITFDPNQATVLLIGVSSGVVPLMTAIRYRMASGEPLRVSAVAPFQALGDVLFRDKPLEIERSLPDFELALALTRKPATRRTVFSRGIDDARMVADVAARLPKSVPRLRLYVRVEAFLDIAADAALALGLEAEAIKTERHGA